MTDKMTRCKGTARDAAQVQEHVSTKASTIFTLAKEHDLRKSSGCTCGRNECVRQSVWGHALHVLKLFVQQQRAGMAGAQSEPAHASDT